MTRYQETLDFLFSQLPMYQRIGPSAMKKDLGNIKALVKYLEYPHTFFPSIHLAGTNGKGTTAHMLASILQSTGLKVGLYTSPHYLDFRERIKINGAYISEEYVSDFVDKIKNDLPEIHPSFFEFSVAMAFNYFKSEKVDIAVIETGLGGRLDSTNVIKPILSVITNISLDHQSMLGDSEYQIAFEKAGIIKPNIPVVIGKFQPSCDQIFLKRAKEFDSSISFASLNWNVVKEENKFHFCSKDGRHNLEIENSEFSPFYIENVITVLESVRVLNDGILEIDETSIIKGLQDFRKLSNYIGRWHILKKRPLIIADSAHNIQAIKRVLDYIKSSNFSHVHFVLGFVKDKDIDQLLSLFDNTQNYYLTKPGVVRGLSVDRLFHFARAHKIQGKIFPSVKEALYAALHEAKPDDLIFVGGSTFIVADALRVLPKNDG